MAPAADGEPGALGLLARSGRFSRRNGARWAPTRRWPWFLAVGGLLIVVGATLLSGAAGQWAVGVGAAIMFVMAIWSSVSPIAGNEQLVFNGAFSIAVRPLSMTSCDFRRQPPATPGRQGI
jgi:hypothetical protein